MLTLDIDRQHSQNDIPSNDELEQWAAMAYLGNSSAEAALVIVDEAVMQTLNRDYRQADKTTNVLSFAANIGELDGVTHLGDIIACAPVISTEAQQQSKSIAAHWAHMLIHGMLHLQNYDHNNDDDANVMENIEIELLAKIGISNPYKLLE
ncbi:MAG: rRNA maturation RNase YbeY [Pseudomonadales bacterium]